MRRKTRNSIIVIVVLVVILGVGFGIYRDEILGRYTFYKGEKCFKTEEYEKATKYLKSSLRLNPDNPRTHLLLMKTYWGRGLWEEMKEERDKIIALGEEAPPIPLVIKDLENMYIPEVVGSVLEDWNFSVYDGGTTTTTTSLGYTYDNRNIFKDADTSEDGVPVVLNAEPCGEGKIPIPAGYTIEITYDGGKALTIYLPEIPYVDDIDLYVATDGSTYYGRWLTQPAQLAPSEEKI